MLRAHQNPKLFDVPSPSLVLALACSDYLEYGLESDLMAVPDHQKAVYTHERFSWKTSGAGRNLTAAYILAYSSLSESGSVMSLVAECALVYSSSTRRTCKLRQTMSSSILVSEVTVSVEAGSLGGVVDLTHGWEAI